MRKGMNGLAMQVQTVLEKDPFSGHVFCFRGRRGDLIKALYWDTQGLCLFAKRLEKGRFISYGLCQQLRASTPLRLPLAVPGRCTLSAKARAPNLCRRSLRLLCGDWVPHDDGCVGGLSRSGRGRQRKRSSKINSRIPSTALDALAGADGENKFSVRQAFAGKALPIDHMKHNNSRATAAVATTVRFPREVSRL
jgi:transposase